jgi:N-acetylneuraminate synthase
MELWRDDYIFVIAEIGINHNGDLDIAKQLIDMAKRCGCDAVKFQKRTIDIVYAPEVLATPRTSPWGTTTDQQKRGLEFGRSEYDEIAAYCKYLGIPWSASGWDLESQDFIASYDVPFNKVASAMTTHVEFLHKVAREGKPTLLSTGMCGDDEVEKALAIFRDMNCPIILLHTTSVYPSPEDILNLLAIPMMRSNFGVPVGYSGHETTVAPSVIAAALGARVLERHITLDRAMYGSDQAASLAERGLRDLVDQLRRLPAMLGDGEKRVMPGEAEVAAKLRYWKPS